MISRQEVVLLSLYNKAAKGDVRAGEALLKRVERLATPTGRIAHESLSEADERIVRNFLLRNRSDGDAS